MATIQRRQILTTRQNPGASGLLLSAYGKSPNIDDYADNEIADMLQGAYIHSRSLLTDGDYIIDMDRVIKAICELEQVAYVVKPTEAELRSFGKTKISNIRTFYIRDYFLITNQEMYGETKHKITKYLSKVGAINPGRNNFKNLYSVPNHSKALKNFQSGLYPDDLFYPIKYFINHKFFQDDYRISDFEVNGHYSF